MAFSVPPPAGCACDHATLPSDRNPKSRLSNYSRSPRLQKRDRSNRWLLSSAHLMLQYLNQSGGADPRKWEETYARMGRIGGPTAC